MSTLVALINPGQLDIVILSSFLAFCFGTICPVGSLLNLAKHPASTVQILGAEKALFRALKTHKDTPKYGLIYHASLVGQTSAKNKGKVSDLALACLTCLHSCGTATSALMSAIRVF